MACTEPHKSLAEVVNSKTMEGPMVKTRSTLRGNLSRTRFRKIVKATVQAKLLPDVSVDHASICMAQIQGSGKRRDQVGQKENKKRLDQRQ